MKNIFFALPLTLLVAGNAMALDPIQKQVTVTAVIPTSSFYVEPVGGNWMNDPQEMAYNSYQETLEPISKQLQVKSTIGPINAYLINPANITSGANSIGLNVLVNGVALTTASEKVTEIAPTGRTVDFNISAKAAEAADGKYVAGNYQGIVNMMFETAAP